MAIRPTLPVKPIDALFPPFQPAIQAKSHSSVPSPQHPVLPMAAVTYQNELFSSVAVHSPSLYQAAAVPVPSPGYVNPNSSRMGKSQAQTNQGHRKLSYSTSSAQSHPLQPIFSYNSTKIPPIQPRTVIPTEINSQLLAAWSNISTKETYKKESVSLPVDSCNVSMPLGVQNATTIPYPNQFDPSLTQSAAIPTGTELKGGQSQHRDTTYNCKSSAAPTIFECVTNPESTLIILDYDDTLLPTNWVAMQHKIGLGDPIPELIQNHLDELSNLAIKTIDFCRKTGRLVVVTNASIEWVTRSGEKFIPTVWRHLKECEIEIVSARDRWQSTGLAQRHWKLRIFEETIKYAFEKRAECGRDCCIISIGDGEGEREACLEMWRQSGVSEWMFKSLKLLAQPTCNQLISEHLLIQQAFPDILKVSQSLDMAIFDYKQGTTRHHQDSTEDGATATQGTYSSPSENFSSIPVQNNSFTSPFEPSHAGKQPWATKNGSRVVDSANLPDGVTAGGTDAFVDAISEKLRQTPSIPFS